MLRRLGLRQRIVALFVGGALVMAGIAGLSLREFSELQRYSEEERTAEQRSDAVHAVVLVALQTATTFSSLTFDINPDEQKVIRAKGEALLSQLEARSEQIESMAAGILAPADQRLLTS